MVHLPVPTPLPRLDVPAKGWAWALWHRMKSKAERRRVFTTTMNNSNIEEDERLRRLRTLVDLGLWGDHAARQDRAYHSEQSHMGFTLLSSVRSGTCTPLVVHLALEAGVDPNWREHNNYNDTLLTMFARHGRGECLPVVIKAGGNPSLLDSCRKTALHILLENAVNNSSARARSLLAAELLLAAGVDINDPGQADPGREQKTAPPIQIVIEKWDVDLTKWMVERGARLDVVDGYQETPMHWVASTSGAWDSPPVELLDYLVAHGAQVDQPNSRGETALWTAIKWRNWNAVDWLLDHDASVRTVPHTFRDGQGYEKPGKKGESLLQALCEACSFSDESHVIADKLTANNPQAWEVITPSGQPLRELLEQKESSWRVLAQASQLEASMEQTHPTPTAARRPRRL